MGVFACGAKLNGDANLFPSQRIRFKAFLGRVDCIAGLLGERPATNVGELPFSSVESLLAGRHTEVEIRVARLAWNGSTEIISSDAVLAGACAHTPPTAACV